MKHTATVEEVKAAYEAYQGEQSPTFGPHLASAMDLAEQITGKRFYDESTGAERRTRMSLAREAIDWPQLERSIGALVSGGGLRLASLDDAKRIGLHTYGRSPGGRYYLSAEDYDRAVEAHARRERNARRGELRLEAEAAVLLAHADEVQRLYRDMVLSEGLTETEPEP